MASASSEPARSLLNLPQEVRNMIYENLKEEGILGAAGGDLIIKSSAKPFLHRSPDTPPSIALAQVGRDIRQDFQPILARGMWITIYTGWEEDRVKARKWLAAENEHLIKNVREYCFAPCKGCSEHLMVPLDAKSFGVGSVEFCGRIPTAWKDKFVEGLEEKVQGLETTRDGRRNMTKKALGEILEMVFTMSKYYVP